MTEFNHPELIKGNNHSDNRGTLSYFNDLDLTEVKRFYIIEHPETKIIRAWQGHKIEQKWFHILNGTFKMIIVKVDNWDHPSDTLNFKEYNLTAKENIVIHVPGGYATGFQANEAGSRLMVFSDKSLDDSKNDDYRFPKELWYKW